MIADMQFQPSPLERLLNLEAKIEQLERTRLDPEINQVTRPAPTDRQIWPADESLLVRLLRRSPIALMAYQANAEFSTRSINSLILEPSKLSTPFQFCELSDGDAVLWIREGAPEWTYESSICRQAFTLLNNHKTGELLTIQRLALFKPIIRGKKWTLVQKGELTTKAKPSPEQSEHVNLITRIENLERQLMRLSSQHDVAIKELRLQVQTNQEEIDKLLSLYKKKI